MISQLRILRALAQPQSRGTIWNACARAVHGVAGRDVLEFSGRRSDRAFCELPSVSGPTTMDLTRAHGYRVAAEPDPPPTLERRLGNFAAHHARLGAAEGKQADGFLWVGPVMLAEAPLHHLDDGFSCDDDSYAWDSHVDFAGEEGKADEGNMQNGERDVCAVEEEAKLAIEKKDVVTAEADRLDSGVVGAQGRLPSDTTYDRKLVGDVTRFASWPLRARRRVTFLARRRYSGGQARYVRKEREMSARRRAARKRANFVPRPVRRKRNDIPAEAFETS